MKLIHHINITVFIEQEEDEKLIAEAVAQLLPENFTDEKIVMEIEHLKIDQGRDIKKLTISLDKERHTKYCIKLLKKLLGEEQCNTVASQEDRVDPKGKLFIRIDKTDFIEHNKAKLIDTGNCIHFSIMLAAYPKTQEIAKGIAKKLFAN